MSSVIRIKRKVGDDPHLALVAAKRRRLDDDAAADAAPAPAEGAVLQFVGTMAAREADLPAALLSSIRSQQKRTDGRRDVGTVAAAILKAKEARRQRHLQEQKVRRFRVVSRRRGELDLSPAAATGGLAGLIDVEEEEEEAKAEGDAAAGAAPQLTCNGQVMERVAAADASWVYDLYVSSAPLPAELADDLLELRPCSEPLLWEHREARHSDSDSPFADDADDSNAEDNWRNDYPDELGDSDYERYLDPEQAHELGSDSDEPLAYGLDEGGSEDGDSADPYERYKARVLRQMGGGESDEEAGYEADDGNDSGDD
ncbi:probable RNA polymerase II nuclear localization protein SLC7A6OS [Pollicipes pollicipes]|uniref:probable RNA polymerase II nuclear localization protein SLC7A6OS n=1 Tax=Pollicipes pollicipes TaxID=41117 RepID=UPI00188498A4|nr:probable RNA polymerase II nuclear localization protein SLC7A6OS [Pollicipes pollicipes]